MNDATKLQNYNNQQSNLSVTVLWPVGLKFTIHSIKPDKG